MATLDAKLLDYLDAMRCVRCGGQLKLAETFLRCAACSHQFPIADGVPLILDDQDRAERPTAGHMEALFRFPSLYRMKINLLRRLNTTAELTLAHFLQQKRVVDVGCGPFIYGYDATLPRSIVGLDLSAEFVRAIGDRDPANLYVVANARKIPFADKTFDIAFLCFVIHHVPGDTAPLLHEVARVTRNHLIIFDHVRSDVAWKRNVQTAYWNLLDSGHHYNTLGEWDELLRPYCVVEFLRTGRMFGNVCEIVLDLRGSDRSPAPLRPQRITASRIGGALKQRHLLGKRHQQG